MSQIFRIGVQFTSIGATLLAYHYLHLDLLAGGVIMLALGQGMIAGAQISALVNSRIEERIMREVIRDRDRREVRCG